MYGINESVYKKLIDYFKNHHEVQEVILFGSRARNDSTFRSDIDLFIFFTGTSKQTLRDKIDEIVGVYSCDVVFSDNINQELQRQIERDGLIIYSQIR